MSHRDDLASILAAAGAGAGGITFAGRALPAGAEAEHLQLLLYEHCYCAPFDGRLAPPQTPAPAADLTEQLSAANMSRDRWEDGWRIEQLLPQGGIVAERGGELRAFWAGEFVSADALPPAAGAHVRVLVRRESRGLQPGFYFAHGETVTDQQDDAAIVRLYWNVAPEGAAALVAALTSALNRMRLPFRLKCLVHPELFARRSDPFVLFLGERYYPAASLALPDVRAAVAASLRPRVPLFTKPLAAGVGVAEDPGDGASFGQHRCRAIAEGVVEAVRAGGTPEARVGVALARLEAHGIDIERPHLRPGSADRYPAWEDAA